MPDGRTYTLKIRLTEDEREIIEENARLADKKVSAFCRHVLLRMPPADDITEVTVSQPKPEKVPPPVKELQRDYDPMAGVMEARRSRLKQRKL